jgi:hypothetical protein
MVPEPCSRAPELCPMGSFVAGPSGHEFRSAAAATGHPGQPLQQRARRETEKSSRSPASEGAGGPVAAAHEATSRG